MARSGSGGAGAAPAHALRQGELRTLRADGADLLDAQAAPRVEMEARARTLLRRSGEVHGRPAAVQREGEGPDQRRHLRVRRQWHAQALDQVLRTAGPGRDVLAEDILQLPLGGRALD